jgi:hypothetical protein
MSFSIKDSVVSFIGNFHQLGFVQLTCPGIVKIMFEYSIISSLLQNSRAFSTGEGQHIEWSGVGVR